MTPRDDSNGESATGAVAAGDLDVQASELPAAYVIPRELAQATLNYLAAQPYREVFALVRAFESLEPAPEPPQR
jgi:hypothetical protein